LNFSQIKDFIEIAKHIAEGVALFIGAVWTYMLFVRQRQKYPRANLSHSIKQSRLSDGRILLQIDVMLANAGQVLLNVIYGILRIQFVSPSSGVINGDNCGPFPSEGREFPWLSREKEYEFGKGECEVEPGEINQFHYDVLLPKGTTTIKVYSYYKNAAKYRREIGWNLTTVHDLPNSAGLIHPDLQGGTIMKPQERSKEEMSIQIPGPAPELKKQEGPKPKPKPKKESLG